MIKLKKKDNYLNDEHQEKLLSILRKEITPHTYIIPPKDNQKA